MLYEYLRQAILALETHLGSYEHIQIQTICKSLVKSTYDPFCKITMGISYLTIVFSTFFEECSSLFSS